MMLSQADLDRCEEISNRKVGKVADIVRAVSEKTGITTAEIYGPSKVSVIARARHLAMYVAHHQGIPTARIGRAMNRDSSSVNQGIKAEKKRRGEV